MDKDYIIVPFKSKKLSGISFAIDTQDYEVYVTKMPSWFLSGAKNNYTTADWRDCPGGRRKIRLHRFLILGIDDDQNKVVDHINGDTLDNRRCNLRILSKSMNVAHRANLNSNNNSGYRGIHWCNTNKRWIACIQHNEDVWWKQSFIDKNDAIKEMKERRCIYNTIHGISERHVEKLPELVESNALMKELYENGSYTHNKSLGTTREKYNAKRRQKTADKRKKMKEELLNAPQTYEVIKELRRIEGDERRSHSKHTGETLSIEEKQRVINEGRRLKKEYTSNKI